MDSPEYDPLGVVEHATERESDRLAWPHLMLPLPAMGAS